MACIILFQSAAADTSYTVRPGDTLAAIARRFGTTIEAIAAANHILNPNLIYVNQTLTIPTDGNPAPAIPLGGIEGRSVRFGPVRQSRARQVRNYRMLTIDLFSDLICPWCFIGKRRLEAALDMRDDLEVDIHWHAFQLNPMMPAEGMARDEYLAAKFGNPENARRLYDNLRSVGEQAGIPFAFERIDRTPITVLCNIGGIAHCPHDGRNVQHALQNRKPLVRNLHSERHLPRGRGTLGRASGVCPASGVFLLRNPR